MEALGCVLQKSASPTAQLGAFLDRSGPWLSRIGLGLLVVGAPFLFTYSTDRGFPSRQV